jgi:hypothetical protein
VNGPEADPRMVRINEIREHIQAAHAEMPNLPAAFDRVIDAVLAISFYLESETRK